MPRRIVAIHQPNFFPWLGYFDKIARADVFCLMDNVQFPKKGGTWTNRVRLLVSGKPTWITAPVDRSYHGVRPIAQMQISNDPVWRSKLLKTVRTAYAKASCFQEVLPFLEDLITNPTRCLAEYNEGAIRHICDAIGLKETEIVRGSTLGVEGEATDLLISMVRALDGTAYLCGGGAGGYQEDEKFSEAGIELIYQNFRHPVYSQAPQREFVAGLSIMDALLHCGFEGTAQLLEGS